MAEMTPELCRAARAMLKWSLSDLATHAGVSRNTLIRFENSKGDEATTAYTNARAIKRALEAAGIHFISDDSSIGFMIARDLFN